MQERMEQLPKNLDTAVRPIAPLHTSTASLPSQINPAITCCPPHCPPLGRCPRQSARPALCPLPQHHLVLAVVPRTAPRRACCLPRSRGCPCPSCRRFAECPSSTTSPPSWLLVIGAALAVLMVVVVTVMLTHPLLSLPHPPLALVFVCGASLCAAGSRWRQLMMADAAARLVWRAAVCRCVVGRRRRCRTPSAERSLQQSASAQESS
mmetsp:Transcript_7282/g.20975  ORF Transcript_7282/g.20975 Transcript_7282/m.20975 type:complete len:208 (-) Transcript_7282:1602-2225(-)